MDEPRIYIACLASYNAGRLHGKWVDLDEGDDASDVFTAIEEILKSSPTPGAEEWAVHDYDGFPCGLASMLGEWPDIDNLLLIASLLREHGRVFAAWCAYDSHHMSHPENFADELLGIYDSEREYGEEIISEWVSHYDIPGHIAYHLDAESVASERLMDGAYSIDIEGYWRSDTDYQPRQVGVFTR